MSGMTRMEKIVIGIIVICTIVLVISINNISKKLDPVINKAITTYMESDSVEGPCLENEEITPK